MRRFLDDGLDELAVHAFKGIPGRAVITLANAALAAFFIPWQAAAAWSAYIFAFEAWSFVFTRRQAQGLPVSTVVRWCHLIGLATVSWGWMGLGWMLWVSGSSTAAIAAVSLWLSVVFFSQTQAYQSRAGFFVGGAVSAVIMMAIVALAPHAPGLRIGPLWWVLALGLLYAAEGVSRMTRARAELVQAQAKLAESEAKYRVLADNLLDVIALSDFHGGREYISPSVEQALGFTAEELLATPNYTMIHPEDKPAVTDAIAMLAEQGGQVTLEYRCFRKNGEIIWAETLFSALPGPDGRPAKLISTSRNIVQRKEAERLMAEALERAEHAATAKSDFMANMTHELRTPLNAIVGFSGLLKVSPRLSPEDARQAQLISEASATLLELVNSVLDFSRLEAGAVEPDPRVFDPVAEAETCASLVREQAEAKGLALRVAIEGDCGPLVGDAPRIRQVLLNFLSNAVKFTSAGEVVLRVSQSDAGDGRRGLHVSVRDTGIGIPASQLAQVFERFTQADLSVSRRFGGTGLGLSISRKIVELLGGHIGVDSVEGHGAIFWFELELPVAAAGEAAPQAESEAAAALAHPIRLLLVEDVAVNRELVAALLSPFDVDIDTACDGVQAIRAMERGTYDLVLMDVQMPVMDGLTATRRIRAMPAESARSTPIIAMTANVLPEQVQKCLDAGMDDHLGKPIVPARLLQALSEWSVRRREASDTRSAAG